MGRQVKILVFILTILQFSCTDQMDAKKAAEAYCSCMKENGFPEKKIYAGTICHAELMKNNQSYSALFIDKRDIPLSDKLTQHTLDSALHFMKAFIGYIPMEIKQTTADVIISTLDLSFQTGEIINFLTDQEAMYDVDLPYIIYTANLKNGLMREGDLLTEAYYINGSRNGIFKRYFERDRKLHVLGFYKDDKPVGKWYFFNEDGGLYLIYRYDFWKEY